jgi:outer membrane protein assembly factor BamB
MRARRTLLRATAVVALLETIAPAQDASWSRFRGPNGTGIAATENLPVEIDAEKNLLWRTPLPPGHSSPVLSRTHVFVTAVDGDDLYTLALARDSGEVAWRTKAPRDRTTKVDERNNAASPTAAVDADTVVVFFPDYGLLAYDHYGEERWRVPLGPFRNVYGMGASPVLVGGRAFLACDQNQDSFLIAVDKGTGKTAWRVDRPRATSGHSTPIVWEPDDGAPQLVLPGSFLLDAYDTRTGERAWWVQGLSFEMKSVPALHDGVIFVNGYASPLNQPGSQVEVPDFDAVLATNDLDGDGLIQKAEMPKSRAAGFFDFVDLGEDGDLDRADWDYLQAALASQNAMLAIRAGGRGDTTDAGVLWRYHRSVPQLPSPLVYGGAVYMLNDQGGLLTMLRPDTGEVIERGRLAKAIDNYYASPVGADGKVYLVSEGGTVTVLPAGGSLEPLWTGELADGCHATPAIADGCVFVRTHRALSCFRQRAR